MELLTTISPRHKSTGFIYVLLLATLQCGCTSLNTLPDRVFVLSLNATENLFTIASVPSVENETYYFRGTPHGGLALDVNTGMVKVVNKMWHNDESNITLYFTVTSAHGSADLDARLYRIERDALSPLFTNSPLPLTCWVPEWIRPDTTIYTLTAIDAAHYGATVKYQLESGGDARFTVETNTGELKVLKRLPFDPTVTFTLAVSAEVVGMAVSRKTLTQVITVKSGDMMPQFSQPEYIINMDEFSREDTPTVNNPIATIKVFSFYDLPMKLTLSLDMLADGSFPANKFRVVNTGKENAMTTGVVIPMESVTAISALTDPRQYRLTLTAKEDLSAFESSVKVIVNVIDINDHTPLFLSTVYTRYNIPDNTSIGTSIITVRAVDRDEDENGRLSFDVDDDHFEAIDLNGTAEIRTKRMLSFGELPMGWYEFTITASDHGSPNKTGSALVRIWVQNMHKEAPVFDPPHQMAHVRENLPAGELIHVVQAHDPDGSPFTFTFQGAASHGMFDIDRRTGYIRLNQRFPENKLEKIYLPVTLDDGTNPATTQNITVDIMAINRPPGIPACTTYKPTVKEGAPNGTSVIVITATDPDSGLNGEVAFSLAGVKVTGEAFSIEQDPVDPYKATLRTKVVFNRESPLTDYTYYRIGNEIKYPVTVEVWDNNGNVANKRSLSTTCFFLVTLEDINNHSPEFDNDDNFLRRPPCIKENTTIGERLFRAFAFDRDLGLNGEVEYSIRNLNCDGCLQIDKTNGYVSAAKELPPLAAITDITAEVMAKDKGTDPETKPAYLNITLRRRDAALPPLWETVNGVDIDTFTLDVKEDAGSTTVIPPLFSARGLQGTEILFNLPTGTYPENNKDNQFEPVVQPGAQNPTMRLRKRTSKQSGGKDPLRYIKLRASHPISADVQPYADKRLKINFIDVNLNTPMFAGRNHLNQYPAHVSTESNIGDTVANVFAIDEDATGAYNSVTYHFDSTKCDEAICGASFKIDRSSGKVTTARKFDPKKDPDDFTLYVYARDSSTYSQQCTEDRNTDCYRIAKSARLTVNLVRPVSDRPYFRKPDYEKEVIEGFYPSKKLFKINAAYTGPDTLQVQHSILEGNIGGPFAVEPKTGQIYQVGPLDFETKSEYILRYGVFHGELSNTTTLIIRVKEKICRKPFTFKTTNNGLPIYSNTLREEDPSQTAVVTLDEAPGVTYTLTGPLSNSFRLDGRDVHITRPLDRDYPMGHSDWQVTVEAVCSENPPPDDAIHTYAIVKVNLIDINDNSPIFDYRTIQGIIAENTVATPTNPADVVSVVAVDYDEGTNAMVKYTMSSEEDGDRFLIGEDDGILKTKETFDREIRDTYRVVVEAKDIGPGAIPVRQYIWVAIGDENDNAPKFSATKSYEATVPENLPLGASVLSVLAEDADIGDNARRDYSTTHSHFTLDSIYATGAGVVKIKEVIDYETLGTDKFLTFKVTVHGPKETDTDTADVTVHITDVNDNAPVLCPRTTMTSLVGTPLNTVQKCPVKPSEECPVSHNVILGEDEPEGTLVAEFTGCDEDTGVNSQFVYAIDYQNTDPDRNFKVEQSGTDAVVRIRNSLDREKMVKHIVHLLAVDQGIPPQTGTATLLVTVGDINDYAPEFENPWLMRVVRETTKVGVVVGEWNVIDYDSATNGSPFTVTLNCQDTANTLFCDNFSWVYADGKITVTTKMTTYERTTTFKRFSASFKLRDSGVPPMEATRELLVEVEDTNTHPHMSATKHVTVYSLNGMFTGMTLGHVYVEDVDDWDRTEKTYNLINAPKGFRLASEAPWDLMLDMGVDPTMHSVSVDVEDAKSQMVRTTMEVDVRFLYETAIHNSGSIRLQKEGLTPTSLIERDRGQSSSLLDKLTNQIAKAVGSGVGDVHVFNIRLVADQEDAVDVYYAVSKDAKAGTFLRPSRLDGNIWLRKAEIKAALGGMNLLMAPVNECPKTKCWKGTCHNRLVIREEPITVDANVTSRVGVNVYRQAACECDTRQFPPESEGCTETTCLNGGTCEQTWANANCSCLVGFEGPRCQKLSRSFSGDGWAWFNPLYLCQEDVIRFRFASSAHGKQQLLMYNGPLDGKDTSTHIILQLRADGYPEVSIDAGTGSVSAHVTGLDASGFRSQPPLDDGRWHTLEIFKNSHAFRLVVDHCENSIITEIWNATHEDRSACEATLNLDLKYKEDDLRMTFSTPLQLGGRRPSSVRLPAGFGDGGLQGCIKDFFHTGEIYDLYIGEVGQAAGSSDDCPAEGATYSAKRVTNTGDTGTTYLPDGELHSTLSNQQCERDPRSGDVIHCTCLPRWRGENCTTGTITRDYLTEKAYLEWKMKAGPSDNRKEFIQLSFRSRTSNSLLFFTESKTTLERCFLQIVDSHLTFTFDLGSGDQTLSLEKLNVTDGLWHTAYVSRYGNQVILTVDGGEGRYYAETEAPGDFRLLLLDGKVDGGAAVTYKRFHPTPDVQNNMQKSYLTDVRFSPARLGKHPLAMTVSENTESAGELQNDNTNDVSVGPVPNPPCDVVRCRPDQTCLDVWRLTYCGCTMNQTVAVDGKCETLRDCSVTNCGPGGICVPQEDFTARCYYPSPEVENYKAHATLSGGALGIIISALLLMLVLLLLSTIVSKKEPPPIIFKPDLDLENHTRENTISYEVEGAGDELPLMADLGSLKIPLGGLQRMSEVTLVKRSSPDSVVMTSTYSSDVNDLILKNKMDADSDDDYPVENVTTFEHEGSASLATSLSSLQSTSTGTGDYAYLTNYGPQFQRLADLYGYNEEDSDESDDMMIAYPENVLVMDPNVNPAFFDKECPPQSSPQSEFSAHAQPEHEYAQASGEHGTHPWNDAQQQSGQPQPDSPYQDKFGQHSGELQSTSSADSGNLRNPQGYDEVDASGHSHPPTGNKNDQPLPVYSDDQTPWTSKMPLHTNGYSDQPTNGSTGLINEQAWLPDTYNEPVFDDENIYDLPSPREPAGHTDQSLGGIRQGYEHPLDRYGRPLADYFGPMYGPTTQTPPVNSHQESSSPIGAQLDDYSPKNYSEKPYSGFRPHFLQNPPHVEDYDGGNTSAKQSIGAQPEERGRSLGVSNLAFDGTEPFGDVRNANQNWHNQKAGDPLQYQSDSSQGSGLSSPRHETSLGDSVNGRNDMRQQSPSLYGQGLVNGGYDMEPKSAPRYGNPSNQDSFNDGGQLSSGGYSTNYFSGINVETDV